MSAILRKTALITISVLVIGGIWKWMNQPEPNRIGAEAVTYFDSHGNWETLCDQIANQPNTARCYVRLVDVYSHRPDFGAYVGFITGNDSNRKFELSLEPGSRLTGDRFLLSAAGQPVWRLDPSVCNANVCKLENEMLGTMISMADQADQFEISFTDHAGKNWRRELSTSDFLAAYASYTQQLAKF